MDSRQFHNLIVIATVEAVSDDGLRARLRLGDIVTDFLPLPALYGKNFTASFPIHDIAQVIVASPSGNLENGVIIGCLFSNDIQPWTTNRDKDGLTFTDGTTLQYDSAQKILRVSSVGKLEITAAETLSLTAGGKMSLTAAQLEIAGAITQTGGDMTSDGISVQNHKHLETGQLTEKPS